MQVCKTTFRGKETPAVQLSTSQGRRKLKLVCSDVLWLDYRTLFGFFFFFPYAETFILLVRETTGGGFGTLRGDKTQGFISKQQAYKIQTKTLNTHPLFLSSVSLLSFPH